MACILLFSAFIYAEELDASVVDLTQGSSGAYTLLSSTGSNVQIAASNCRTPVQLDPSFDLMITPSPACTQSAVQVYSQYYDFAAEAWTSEQPIFQCTIPPGTNCKATVPIKLGGKGSGDTTQDLLKLRATCNEVAYTKTFTFKINHVPSDSENNAVNKIASVEPILQNAKTALSSCGSCCDALSTKISSAQSKLDEAKDYLKQCDLTKSLGSGTAAFSLAKEAETSLTQKQKECSTLVNLPALPEANKTVPPANASQPPITQPLLPPSKQPSLPPEQQAPQQPQKPCPILFAFPLLGLFFVFAKRR